MAPSRRRVVRKNNVRMCLCTYVHMFWGKSFQKTYVHMHVCTKNMPIFRYTFFILIFALVLTVSSCAKHGARHPKAKYSEPPVVETPQAGPEREASNHLIKEGQKYLNFGMYNQAAYSFQEAVNVDPNNGAAYYYLAYTKYRSGEYGRVPILLDRASSLLKGDEKWEWKIEKLQESVKEAQP